jgi:hypothetical protein
MNALADLRRMYWKKYPEHSVIPMYREDTPPELARSVLAYVVLSGGSGTAFEFGGPGPSEIVILANYQGTSFAVDVNQHSIQWQRQLALQMTENGCIYLAVQDLQMFADWFTAVIQKRGGGPDKRTAANI